MYTESERRDVVDFMSASYGEQVASLDADTRDEMFEATSDAELGLVYEPGGIDAWHPEFGFGGAVWSFGLKSG